jgi:hypothetical protein
MLYRDGWKCMLHECPHALEGMAHIRADIFLAACDVEGNFLVVKVSPLARSMLPGDLLTRTATGFSIYKPSLVHAPRCVSPSSLCGLSVTPQLDLF